MALQSGVVLANATFEEILDDLSSRFIINVPDVELKSVERICFQVEQAHWFYEDFVRELKPELPSFQLKTFSAKIFKHCPLLRQWAHEHERAYADFMQYRFRIPVCGAIMINSSLDKCVLVKGWSSKSGWGFPKGKINQDEEYDCCAIREVLEETGYDIEPLLKRQDYIELTMREQRIRLYLIVGVPEDTDFVPRTRKEISEIAWFKFDNLPTYKTFNNIADVHMVTGGYRFYMVVPFVSKLRHFVGQRKKASRRHNDGPKAQQSSTTAAIAAAAAAATASVSAVAAAASASAVVAAVSAANEPESTSPKTTTEPEETTDVLKSLLGIGEASTLGTASPKVYSGSESPAFQQQQQQQQIFVQQQQLQMAQQAKQLQLQLQEQQRQQLHQHQHQQQQQLQQHQQQQLQLQLQHHPMASPVQQPGNNALLQHLFATSQQQPNLEPSFSSPTVHRASIVEEMLKNNANATSTAPESTSVETETTSPTDNARRNNLLSLLQGHPGGGAPFAPTDGHHLMAMLRSQPAMAHGAMPLHPVPQLFQGPQYMHPQHYDMPFPPPA